MAPQRLEKIESAPGNGMGSEDSNLQDLVHGARLIVRDSGSGAARTTSLQRCKGAYLPSDTPFPGRFRRRGIAAFGAAAFRPAEPASSSRSSGRGSGRLSDGERLHEPLGGRGEDLQNVETLLPRGRHDGPEERENPRALEGPEAAGDLHLDLHH